jgi:peptidyl-prolyl cis-trans isomerase SurA
LRGGTELIIDQTEVSHILIKPNEIRTSDDALQLLQDIRTRIASKQDSFSDMARTYSDDPGSAREGGKLGWVTPGTMVPEFEAVMGSTRIDELSAPFLTGYGWHILWVTDRRQKDVSEEFRRNRARTLLQRRKYDAELDGWLKETRANAYVEVRI